MGKVDSKFTYYETDINAFDETEGKSFETFLGWIKGDSIVDAPSVKMYKTYEGGYDSLKATIKIGSIVYGSVIDELAFARINNIVGEKIASIKTLKGVSNPKILDEGHNVVEYAKYKEVLRTTESANPLVESLRTTGELPSSYVTKQKQWLMDGNQERLLTTMFQVVR